MSHRLGVPCALPSESWGSAFCLELIFRVVEVVKWHACLCNHHYADLVLQQGAPSYDGVFLISYIIIRH